MRFKGTLVKWNDDRGFGFIKSAEDGTEIFVHISTFPRGSKRPRLNETLTYEIGCAPDGRQRAVAVARPDSAVRSQVRSDDSRNAGSRRFSGTVLGIVVMLSVAAYACQEYRAHSGNAAGATRVGSEAEASSALGAVGQLRCDGRKLCSQMRSCQEARYFLQHCPGTQLDGDGDGEPCERQWCAN